MSQPSSTTTNSSTSTTSSNYFYYEDWESPDCRIPTFGDVAENLGLFISEAAIDRYGLFTSSAIRCGTPILSCWDERKVTMKEYLYLVSGSKKRHPHEFLADREHHQSLTLDDNNFEVLWIDLLRVKSPMLFLNSANNADDVNVKLISGVGWAYRSISILYSSEDIGAHSELLDSYML